MKSKSSNRKQLKPLLLHEVLHHETFTVLSLHLNRGELQKLSDLGIEPGFKIEVLCNNHKGTVAIRSRKGLVILGRHESFKIKLLPVAKPVEEESVEELPELLYLKSVEG